jgi:hypothetical protein
MLEEVRRRSDFSVCVHFFLFFLILFLPLFPVFLFNLQGTFYAGNEVTVVAAYPDRTPQDRIRATYSIDGREGGFSIQNGGGASDFYRRVVRIYDLSNGEHTLD